ncbi:MAG TPA: hypothetical protein VGB47_15150 [Thermoanaerobaculia bacterium]
MESRDDQAINAILGLRVGSSLRRRRPAPQAVTMTSGVQGHHDDGFPEAFVKGLRPLGV